MKGIVILFFVMYAAVGRAQNTILVDECPEEQEIDWTIELLIRHDDCNKFYKCTFGKPVEYICPADLWFDLETQKCDWRHIVDCTDRYVPGEDPTTPSTTTPAPTTPTTTTTTTTTTPAPTTTTTTTTTTPRPTTTTTTTTTARPTTPPTTTTTTTAPSTFLPNGCPTNPHIHWLLPHETNCNQFYYCVWGLRVLRSCPSTLHFNRVIQVCDWPWDAGCPTSLNKHMISKESMRYI